MQVSERIVKLSLKINHHGKELHLKYAFYKHIILANDPLTVESRYNKLLGPSEITLLYQTFVISGLQKQ